MHTPLLKKSLVLVDSQTESDLYEVRRKIYPRAVSGSFFNARWTLIWLTQIIFYGLAWLTWNGRQAVLFDLGARKFYIFGLILWPQDFIYLTVILVISALSLFLFTAVAGRLWCGYACPQTVYTEIFLWVERKIEGDRLARIKLDQQPLSTRKLALKGAKHAIWILFALWTGITFVGYFTPIRELVREVANFSLGPWETFWVLFYGFATYGNAGFMREQVCKYMCPYARFQGVMFDPDTLVISYDPKRGEPRGARSKKADYKAEGLGDCVDCNICVQVCPTGIDIRNGLQYECIGCAACIDGCDQVMGKMGYPKGLIRYSTENAMQRDLSPKQMLARVFRPRVLIYTVIMWSIIAGAGAALYLRVPLKVDVIRDRKTLAREIEDGRIENLYRLQIMNTDDAAHRFVITASGLASLEVEKAPLTVGIEPASSLVVPVELLASPSAAPPGSHKIEFHVHSEDNPNVAVTEKSSFLIR